MKRKINYVNPLLETNEYLSICDLRRPNTTFLQFATPLLEEYREQDIISLTEAFVEEESGTINFQFKTSLSEEQAIKKLQEGFEKAVMVASAEKLQTYIQLYGRDIDLDLPNKFDNPPLIVAAKRKCGSLNIIRILLEKGANSNAVDKEGNDIFFWLSQNKYVDPERLLYLLKQVKNKIFDRYSKNNNGETTLDITTNSEKQNIKNLQLKFQKILSHDSTPHLQTFIKQHGSEVDPNAINRVGNYPLNVVAKRTNPLTKVTLLLEQGADPKLVSDKGNNFLHDLLENETLSLDNPATLNHFSAVINLAVKKEINLRHKNFDNKTPFDIARSRGADVTVLELLQNKDIENDINQESVTYDNSTSQQDNQKAIYTNKSALSFLCQHQDDYTIPSSGDDGFSDYVV